MDHLFSVDTSFFINGWNKLYPPRVAIFARIWDRVQELIKSGNVLVCDAVWEELKQKDDAVFRMD